MAPAYAPSPEGSAIFRPLSTPALFTALSTTNPAAHTTTSTPTAPTPAAAAAPPAHTPLSPPESPLHPLVSSPSATPSPASSDSPYAAYVSAVPPSQQKHHAANALFDDDPMALPHHPPADLGDDDSFSPDIVSGYQFRVPLARDDATWAVAHDEALPEQADEQARLQEHDHRTDAVYDRLDEIGEWVAGPAPAHGVDLTKKLARAVAVPEERVVPTRQMDNLVSASVVSHNVARKALATHDRAEDRRREHHARDKLDRATVEQVLDPRTRMILFRLLSRNRLRTLDGCVSTGKEANVYFGTAASDPAGTLDITGFNRANPGLLAHDSSPDAAVAVKVFKTSILQFKDRERYVAGEFRFRRGGYQRGSNRKMVQQWAEKEFRNQMRLQEAGIPAPVPLLLKPPVLIMSFFGKDGWPAPRLKDASLSNSRLTKAYFRVCMLMRRMFRVARLVHGDLSEYNMLYWKGEVIIIDVSQSVEADHPMAMDFLRRDCANVNDFFRRSGVHTVLSVRELYEFVTAAHIGESEGDQTAALTYLLETASTRDMDAVNVTMRDDEVFMRSYIPRTLQEIEIRDEQFRPSAVAEEMEGNLFTKLTGLSITQKRERVVGRSKSTSVPEAPYRAVSSENIPQRSTSETPNLEIPCGEPATVRSVPTPEKYRIGSSSSCTSNGSSRPNGDETEASKLSKAMERTVAAATLGLAKDSVEGIAAVQASGTHGFMRREEDDTYDDIDETESSSGDDWDRKSREEAVDPFAGMTKKEWKKKVKADNRERREHKVPKHVKKRKETLAKRRRNNK